MSLDVTCPSCGWTHTFAGLGREECDCEKIYGLIERDGTAELERWRNHDRTEIATYDCPAREVDAKWPVASGELGGPNPLADTREVRIDREKHRAMLRHTERARRPDPDERLDTERRLTTNAYDSLDCECEGVCTCDGATAENDTDDLLEFDDMATSCGTSGCEKPAIVELKDADDVTGEDPNRCLDCLEYYLRENHWGRDW